MKVSKLIKLLKKLDPDLEVVLSSDGEGNGFNGLTAVELQCYDGENMYETPEYVLSDQGKEAGYTWEDLPPKDSRRVIVLWP